MSTPAPQTRNLARRLIALEAARGEPPAGGAGRVCDRLRVPLARLAGVAGFRSLMSRALALARSEQPSLAVVQVRPDGSLEGVDGPEHNTDGGMGDQAGALVVTKLLELLVTFIGEPLTLQLVRDAWPAMPPDELDLTAEGQP